MGSPSSVDDEQVIGSLSEDNSLFIVDHRRHGDHRSLLEILLRESEYFRERVARLAWTGELNANFKPEELENSQKMNFLDSSVNTIQRGAGKVKDFIFKLNIAIRYLQIRSGTGTTTKIDEAARSKKLIRKGKQVHNRLTRFLGEIQKVTYNLHSMLSQIVSNQWELTQEEFNSLFDELRDGSWHLEKLLDEDLNPVENVRRHLIILDVYCKVFIDDYFSNWKQMGEFTNDIQKDNFTLELIALHSNFIDLISQYAYIKERGHISVNPAEQNQRLTFLQTTIEISPNSFK